MNRKHNIIEGSRTRVAASLYLAVFLVMLAVLVRHNTETTTKAQFVAEQVRAERHFDNLPVKAKAVYIYDTSSGKALWEKNSELPLPLASVTKVMTALCALDNLESDGYVLIPQSRLTEYGDPNLIAGERVKVRDLVSYTLVKSSNDGAAALADILGGSEQMTTCMNNKAEDMGFFDMRFHNETGLDIGDKPGAYGTAAEAALLLINAYKSYPDIFEATRRQSYQITEGSLVLEGENTNKAQSDIIGMQIGKTGLTDLAGGNLVFAMNAGLGHTIAIAILGSGEEERFNDAVILSEAVIDYLGETR